MSSLIEKVRSLAREIFMVDKIWHFNIICFFNFERTEILLFYVSPPNVRMKEERICKIFLFFQGIKDKTDQNASKSRKEYNPKSNFTTMKTKTRRQRLFLVSLLSTLRDRYSCTVDREV
uniref:Uncharacterized protein n=1 Tax=Cacopsylla melanoneura TaxID=428564 RepID=A0A8D8R143_9HEMI